MLGDPSSIDPEVLALGLALLLWGGAWAAYRRPGRVIAHSGAVLLLLVGISLAAAGSLVQLAPLGLRLRIDPSTDPLLPRGDPARALHRDATLTFGDDQVYVVAVECPAIFEPGCLREIETVAAAISRLDGVQSVTSLLSATSFGYDAAEDWIEVRDFIEEIPSDPDELAALRKQALADPVYRRTLISPDARTCAIEVRLDEMTDAAMIASNLDRRIESILSARERAGVAASFRISGRPHFKMHVYRGMVRDLGILIPLAIVAIGAVLAAFHGNRRGVLLPLANGLLAVLWTFGAMAALGRPLSLLTVLIGPTLLAVGSVHGLHVVARYDEEVAGAGTAREAAERTLAALLRPLAIAASTTALGFAALLVSDVPAVTELGAFSVLGMGAIALLAVAGVPAALARMPLRSGRPRLARALSRWLERALLAVSRAIARHVGLGLASFGCAAIVAVLALPRIEIDTDYLSYFDPDAPVRRDFDAINRALSGAVPLYVIVDTEGPAALRDPAMLRALEALQQRVERVEGVGRALSFLDPLRVLNRAFHEDDPAQERIPDTRGEIAELLFMIPKADLGRYATLDHARANVVARVGEVGSAAVLRVAGEIEAAATAVPLPEGVRVSVTGNALLLARSADGVARTQPLSVALAALGIFGFVALGLRSPRLGALAMVPNLVPVLFFFGLLGLGAAPLSLPTSLIGAVALGIAIDDTVHLLVRYRDERIAGCDPEQAVSACLRSVGRPVAITSLMLSAAFGTIALSEFATLREFGVLTAVTMGLCLITDLVLLPALLLRARI
ncbi:MAG: MMPL family transporter [Myxococcota bacterium]|nr:MMPL family transporter [Myxococcota bacterium]